MIRVHSRKLGTHLIFKMTLMHLQQEIIHCIRVKEEVKSKAGGQNQEKMFDFLLWDIVQNNAIDRKQGLTRF